MSVTVSADDIKRVKGLGFLQQKGTDTFNARTLTRNGKITVEEARKVADAAEKYGNGELAFTTRQTIEVQGIHYDHIEAFTAAIEEAGLMVGGTGPKVRPIVSCKGTTCQYGLYDTYGLSEKNHERFYVGYHGVKLPHKFKIATGGCPNNCVKPDLNDVGIIGQKVPTFDADKCKSCKVCVVAKVCPMKAASKAEGEKLVYDKEKCISCGRCLYMAKCPFGAMTEEVTGYKVTLGGRWGKKVGQGIPMSKVFTSEEEVLDIVEKIILFFKDQGVAGERLADTVARVGFEKAEAMILSNELFERKAEILAKE